MRVPILLLCSAFIFNAAQAENLSDADRETLLENLEKLRENADAKVDARFSLAISAYHNAMTSDDAAMDLYLKCLEKVNFEDQLKKTQDFREWKRNEAEKLASPGMRLALRHQLRWLVLTLKAASPKAERDKLIGDAQECVDSIFRDFDKIKDQEQLLNQSVISTVFARAYDINNVKLERWSQSPVELDEIYDSILLPPYRNPNRLAGLRAGWTKRIQQETQKREFWSGRRNRQDRQGGRDDRDDREDKRIGTIESMQSPEYTKFLQEEVPKLQWDMEVDLFKNGDQNGAAVRMLAHLNKHLSHPSSREWGEELQKLLKPVAPVAPDNTANANP